MQLCESANDSIVVLDFKSDYILALEGNRLVGFIGRLYDGLLIKLEKRKSVWIHFWEFESKIESFNSKLFLIRTGKNKNKN